MRHTATRFFLFMLAAAICAATLVNTGDAQKTSTPAKAGYHLLKKIEVGGEGGWDYLFVDGAARRLYVSRGTRVMVFDADTGKSVGEIPDTTGVHGVAIADDLGRGFTSNGRDGSVTIFDSKTLKTISKVKVGTNPDCIIYDPATHRVFAFNRGSSSFSAIDAKSGEAAAPVDLGGHPEFAVADGKGMVFVNLDNKSEIVAIDSRKLEVKAHWPVEPGEDPSGLAIDRKRMRLFSVCGNKKMMVLDATTGKVVADLPIGTGPDAAGFDPETNLAFSSNGEGTLTVIHQDSADKYSVVENVTTQRGARTMAVDPKTHNVFLATAVFGAPPAPTPERPNPRGAMVPNSFVILIFGK
jgi:DNA-binding beta-propeller fold protein YncE